MQELFDQTLEDIRLGRMTPLVPAAARDVLGTRRFGVSQVSAKGATKLRRIDDFAESLVNETTSVEQRISMAKVSELLGIAAKLREASPHEELVILKSDFRSAYRSVPIMEEHLEFSDVLVCRRLDI